MTLYERIALAAHKYHNLTAIIYNNKKISYQDLIKKIDYFASCLVSLGVKNKDIVTVCMPNTPEAVIALYAINKIGAICYEVHPQTSVNQMEEYLNQVNSKVLITLNIFIKSYQELLNRFGELKIIICNPFQPSQILKKTICNIKYRIRHPRVYSFYKLSKNSYDLEIKMHKTDSAIYLNSGGTSGKSKIIELSSLAVNTLAEYAVEILDQKENLVGIKMFGVLPMFHGFGLCMGIHTPLILGGTATLMIKFKTKETIKLIKRKQLNVLLGVPTLYKALLNRQSFYGEHLKNLKVAFIGGDYVSNELLDKFNNTMIKYNSNARLLEGYGLTETVAVCAVNTLKNYKKGTVGQAVGDIKIKIIDLDSKTELLPNNYGEICISGPTIMNGYYNNKELTNQTIIKDECDVSWIYTGDYGCIDSDNYLIFKQRLKRIVKVSGYIVCPSEIERIIGKRDEVLEVYATDVLDDYHGSKILLYIVKDQKFSETNLDYIINETIEQELGKHAVPKHIVYIDQLPKTTIGKIDIKELERKKNNWS